VAKRLAIIAPSSSEQEYKDKYNDIYDMYEKESLLLPCAKYGGGVGVGGGGGGKGGKKSLIQKRFALLHRSHVYNHLMKVAETALAIFAFLCSQKFHF
jgi:hypothetical protein